MKKILAVILFGCSAPLLAWHSNGWVATFNSIPSELPAQTCAESQQQGINYKQSRSTPSAPPGASWTGIERSPGELLCPAPVGP